MAKAFCKTSRRRCDNGAWSCSRVSTSGNKRSSAVDIEGGGGVGAVTVSGGGGGIAAWPGSTLLGTDGVGGTAFTGGAGGVGGSVIGVDGGAIIASDRSGCASGRTTTAPSATST